MPNSVNAAAPSSVMPWALATAFQQSRAWEVYYNRYPDASMQSRAIPATSRKRWTVTERATAAQLAAIRDFYIDQGGGWKEFYFYDVYYTIPLFSYDNTGSAEAGRYVVCFDGAFQQALGLGRNTVQFALVEVS